METKKLNYDNADEKDIKPVREEQEKEIVKKEIVKKEIETLVKSLSSLFGMGMEE